MPATTAMDVGCRSSGLCLLAGLLLTLLFARSSRGAAAHARAGQRHPPVVPLRFHGQLFRRPTGRQGGVRVPPSQPRQAFAVLQDRGECRGAEAGRPRRNAPAAPRRRRRTGARAHRAAGPTAAQPERPPTLKSPAPATPTTRREQLRAVQQACTLNDFVSHCSWIAPNNPEILQCLKANAADLSPNCQAAVPALPAATRRQRRRAGRPQGAGPEPVEPHPAGPSRHHRKRPPAPRPPHAAPSRRAEQPTARADQPIRAACRSDFMSHCSGVQPGGAEALQCLKRNEAQLSAACRSAVAAIGGGTRAARRPGRSDRRPPHRLAPLTPMPMRPAGQALAIVQICGVEVRSLCAGVPFGGGRIISCLAANASSLSPSCYGALSAAARR